MSLELAQATDRGLGAVYSCDHGRLPRQRFRAASILIVLSLAAVGCGQNTAKQTGGTAPRPQTTAPRAVSYAVRNDDPTTCARREPSGIPPNAWAPTRRRLAPLGAIAIRLCHYGELPRVLLVRSTLLTSPSIIGRLLNDFDMLPTPPRGVKCPEDNGSEIVASIAYANGRRVTVTVQLGGCGLVTNGNLLRSASGFATANNTGPALVAELQHQAPS
jgi:hypothetical protein